MIYLGIPSSIYLEFHSSCYIVDIFSLKRDSSMMFDHQRIGDISGLGTAEVEFLNNFSLPQYNDGNKINQHTGMPFTFSEFLKTDETEELPSLSAEDLQEINNIEDQAVNKSTAKQTKNHVDELKHFLESRKLPNEIESIPPKYLRQYLRLWFSTMKKRDGGCFSLSTFACKRASIHRYLQEKADYNLIGNDEFRLFEKTYNAVRHKSLVTNKKRCSATSGYQPIEKEDMVRLDKYFDRSTPKRLQQEVFFNIVYHNGFRGREWIRSLKKEDIHIESGPDGLKYVTIVKNENEKNVKINDYRNIRQVAMYEIPDCEKCPVAGVEKYLSMLPTENTALFPKPKTKWTRESFYCEKEVLGKNSLHDFMKTISRDANLHNVYTNHCIRVSLVTWLKENDVPNDEIKAVTNQKSDASIDRYNKRMTSAKKRKLSEKITEQLRSSTANTVALPSESTSAATQAVQINQLFIAKGGDEPQMDEKPTLVIEKNGAKVLVYL